MRLFLLELSKVLKNKVAVSVFLVILLCNAGLLFSTNPGSYYDATAYTKAYQRIQHLNENEKSEFIDNYLDQLIQSDFPTYTYTHYFQGDWELFTKLKDQVNQVTSYPNYLTSIKESAENTQIAIYKHQSNFQKRNDIKTMNDYKGMENITLTFTNELAFQNLVDFAPSDLFALSFLFFIIVSLLVYEKEHHLFYLLKSTSEGRGGLISSKISVILLVTATTTLLIWGSNFIICFIKYGSIPLSVSLQSISSFTTSILHYSTGQYLILFLASKLCIYSLLSMIMLLITLKAKRTTTIYVLVLLLFGTSILLYFVIPENSSVSLLKYINLIPYILVTPIYSSYFNLNIAGYPMNSTHMFWIISLSLLLFFIFYNTYSFSKGKTADTLKPTTYKRKRYVSIHTNLLTHECYKLFIMQKGAIILLLFTIASFLFIVNTNHPISTDESYYQSYMQTLQGPYTNEKKLLIETETKRFEELHQQKEQAALDLQSGQISEREKIAIDSYINTQSLSEQAFRKVQDRVSYVEQHLEYPLIYETGYLELFGKSYTGYTADFTMSLLLVIVILLLFTPSIATEYSSGMIRLIQVQTNGKKEVFRCKWKLYLFLTTGCTIIAYAGQVFHIVSIYGLSNLFATNLAIPELAHMFPMPLLLQITLIYIIRLGMAYLTLLLVFLVSQTIKNTYTALSILGAALVFPLGIAMISIPFINNISLNVCYSANALMDQFSPIPLILLFIVIPSLFFILKKKI